MVATTKSEPSTGRYVPPHKRARQEVPASSLARDPAYGVTSEARSVLLGGMLQSRVSRREDLQKALDNMTADDPARENTEAELQELGAVIKNLKEEQTATRRGTKAGRSSRQDRDKPEMGGRLAYIKERSRKRAEKHRLSTQPATDFSGLLHTLSRGGAMLACKTAEACGSEPFRLEPHGPTGPLGPLRATNQILLLDWMMKRRRLQYLKQRKEERQNRSGHLRCPALKRWRLTW